ncbi:DUF2493 domain-containing protein [Actinomadura sp. NPDC048021]|uniref:DUF2493 domain-containing protein n=1 Tax=Actinomadura sp. NPDC048021 TaxID=3155385 RepID=UPI0034010860
MKLIVTGSRDWKDWYYIWSALELFTRFSERVTLVHGDCPDGVDSHADDWGETNAAFVGIIRYPADWNKYGKAAGPKRNKQMVNDHLDADYVLAFPLGESKGTRGCMKYAKWMGLDVINLGEKL